MKENNVKTYGEWSKGKKLKDVAEPHERKQIQMNIKILLVGHFAGVQLI